MGDSIIIPVFTDHKQNHHINKPLFLYIYLIKFKTGYIIPINTEDCINIENLDLFDLFTNILNNITTKYVINLDHLYYFRPSLDDRFVDLRVLEYISTGKVSTHYNRLLPTQSFMYHLHYNMNDVNISIPITKHIEYLEMETENILNVIKLYSENEFELSLKMFNNIMLPTLNTITQAGIPVDTEFPVKENIKNNCIYTTYNPFNLTSRPTCSSGKFSFSSIAKDSQDRKHIISRFGEDGTLVLFDYNSYHISLICEIINYKFNEYAYTQLGKIYFGKEELTHDEITDAKILTFRVLYGGIPTEFLQIEFFKRVDKFIKELWSAYNSDGCIYTRLFKRRYNRKNYPDMNAQKLFNYYLQSFETENNMMILNKINTYLQQYSTKVILYIYDSILIDFKFEDGKDVINQILNIFKNDKYDVSIFMGNNYLDLVKI